MDLPTEKTTYREPTSSQEADEICDALCAEIHAINLQLADANLWRTRAVAAMRAREAVLQKTRAWARAQTEPVT